MKCETSLTQNGGGSTSLNPRDGIRIESEFGAEVASEIGETESADLSFSL